MKKSFPIPGRGEAERLEHASRVICCELFARRAGEAAQEGIRGKIVDMLFQILCLDLRGQIPDLHHRNVGGSAS